MFQTKHIIQHAHSSRSLIAPKKITQFYYNLILETRVVPNKSFHIMLNGSKGEGKERAQRVKKINKPHQSIFYT